jgi:hypothetical protein
MVSKNNIMLTLSHRLAACLRLVSLRAKYIRTTICILITAHTWRRMPLNHLQRREKPRETERNREKPRETERNREKPREMSRVKSCQVPCTEAVKIYLPRHGIDQPGFLFSSKDQQPHSSHLPLHISVALPQPERVPCLIHHCFGKHHVHPIDFYFSFRGFFSTSMPFSNALHQLPSVFFPHFLQQPVSFAPKTHPHKKTPHHTLERHGASLAAGPAPPLPPMRLNHPAGVAGLAVPLPPHTPRFMLRLQLKPHDRRQTRGQSGQSFLGQQRC